MKLFVNCMEKVKVLDKIKQTKGYALGELLITVSILTVIMGLSMVFVSGWASDLKMRELDSCAKNIYVEIQNQFASKETAKGFVELYNEMQTNKSDRFLRSMPQDYDVNENEDRWKQLCYLQKEDSVIQMLVSETLSAYQTSGNYLVELNPSSGEIYGVFYWEKNQPISYDIIESLEGRTLDDRAKAKIGYYRCSTENKEISNGITVEQVVELINSEELYLKVTLNNAVELLEKDAELSMDLTIADEHGHKWFSENVDQKVTKVTEEDSLVYYILLDSMQSGRSFREITENRLVSGDNISIVIESEVSKGSSYCLKVSEVEGNSLFAEKSEAVGTTIKVGNLRHFRNLDSKYYNYMKNETEGTVKIIQIADICFENGTYAWQDGLYIGKGKGAKPLSSIEPVRNDSVFIAAGKDTDFVEYDGNGFILKDFKIQAVADYAGMFATAQNVRFRNVKIEDMTLSADGRNYVGGLVGAIVGGEVIDCDVYLKQYTEDGLKKKYYVHQSANDSAVFENRMQEKVATMRVSGAKNVGGLIGSAEGITITTSYASVNVHGEENVGGFIGNANKVNIFMSSSTGNVHGKSNRGSFIGYFKNVKFENSDGYGKVKDIS